MTTTDDVRALADDYINDVNASDIRRVCEWAADLIDALEAENGLLKAAITLAQEVGLDWRMDWSFFDGRILRDQMNDLDGVASGKITPDTYRRRQGWITDD